MMKTMKRLTRRASYHEIKDCIVYFQPRKNSFSSPPPVPDNTFTSDPGSTGSSCNVINVVNGHSSSNGSRGSKVIGKFRKSLTEPLLHYFHELQVSPDSDEPEVLNTPRSIVPPTDTLNSLNNNNNSHNNINGQIQNLRRRSRNLFNSKKDSSSADNSAASGVIDEAEEEEGHDEVKSEAGRKVSVPPPIITDM